MRFARPPNGFHVKCTAQAADMSRRLCAGDPDLERFKADLIERLRMTGHREGVDLNMPDVPGAMAFVADLPPALQRRGMQVWIVYQVLGDEIVFHRVRVDGGLRPVE